MSENIVKKTAKDLGLTQKALAERIKVEEVTLSRWAKGKVDTPQWALEMFELLKTEKKFNEAKEKFKEVEDFLHLFLPNGQFACAILMEKHVTTKGYRKALNRLLK